MKQEIVTQIRAEDKSLKDGAHAMLFSPNTLQPISRLV
jgi:hypothetical protein